MSYIDSSSVDLVVTSPPYPMIEMWDEIFSNQNESVREALREEDGRRAFELMHVELDKVWDECFRVLNDGGIACINIGDATRTIGGEFRLYTNHARILSHCTKIGLSSLPTIIWRKQTNAPNKFMGSGVLPVGAYVTLEHEYILVLKKGKRRTFLAEADKKNRQSSSFFWEERNKWFSDVWFDLKGVAQKLSTRDTRERSAAYPFELPYRLINMYSVKGDTVLDPFLGTGTTSVAAMTAQRNSIGIEISEGFQEKVDKSIRDSVEVSRAVISGRLGNHASFANLRIMEGKKPKYKNSHYLFPVMTREEQHILFGKLTAVHETGPGAFEATYS